MELLGRFLAYDLIYMYIRFELIIQCAYFEWPPSMGAFVPFECTNVALLHKVSSRLLNYTC